MLSAPVSTTIVSELLRDGSHLPKGSLHPRLNTESDMSGTNLVQFPQERSSERLSDWSELTQLEGGSTGTSVLPASRYRLPSAGITGEQVRRPRPLGPLEAEKSQRLCSKRPH